MTGVDVLGWRGKIAVVVPATNTTVQPEFDDMRPRGITNHVARIAIADMPLTDDAEFEEVIDAVGHDLFSAVDRAMSCQPRCLVMGMSIPTFWDGRDGSDELRRRLQDRARVPVHIGSEACAAALRRLPDVRRIGVLSPYQDIGDRHVAQWFTESGWEVARVLSVQPPAMVAIARSNDSVLRDALGELRSLPIDAIVQVGTNLPFGTLAGEAEGWLGLPVIAINTATYWWTLRSLGVDDRLDGFGALLRDH